MPNSLRCMISKLRHKGQISDVEYKELITKLENHDRVIKEQTNTAEWIKSDVDEIYCSKCGCKLQDEQIYIPKNYCPNCGAKMKGETNGT